MPAAICGQIKDARYPQSNQACGLSPSQSVPDFLVLSVPQDSQDFLSVSISLAPPGGTGSVIYTCHALSLLNVTLSEGVASMAQHTLYKAIKQCLSVQHGFFMNEIMNE